MPSKPKLALLCTVWGQGFTEFFAGYCLTSLLAEGNLPRVSETADIAILLYTDRESFALLQRAPCFAAVSRYAEIRPVFLDGVRDSTATGHWEPWHHALLHHVPEFDGVVVLIPDCVYIKDWLSRVAGALERADVVYYAVPEVCQELVTRKFDGCFTADGALALDEIEMADVVVQYMHPKQAAGDATGRFLVTHPEFVVTTRKDRLGLTYLVTQPMAFRTDIPGLSYTFNPLTDGADIAFLEIVGVGCGPTFKYFEQYLHWPTLGLRYSRTVNLASWAAGFRESGSNQYADTEAVIELRDGRAAALYRTRQAHPRTRLTNRLLDQVDAVFRIYMTGAIDCTETTRQCVALAATLPGVRRALARLGPALTVMLPAGRNQLDAVIRALEASPRPQEAFIEFLLLHVLRGHVRPRENQLFTLERKAAPEGRITQLRVFEPALRPRVADAIVGRLVSAGRQLTAELLVYLVHMDYGAPDHVIDRLALPSPAASSSGGGRC